MLETKEVIQQIKDGDKAILNKVYGTYRNKFIGWAINKYGSANLDVEVATEIYQDTVVTLYENIYKGKLVEITTTIQAYLFAIGINKIREWLRTHGKQVAIEEDFGNAEEEIEEDEIQVKIDRVTIAVNKMGPPCKTILTYFYFEKKSMTQIAELMEYSNAGTVKTKKHKCIQRIRKMVFEAHN